MNELEAYLTVLYLCIILLLYNVYSAPSTLYCIARTPFYLIFLHPSSFCRINLLFHPTVPLILLAAVTSSSDDYSMMMMMMMTQDGGFDFFSDDDGEDEFDDLLEEDDDESEDDDEDEEEEEEGEQGEDQGVSKIQYSIQSSTFFHFL